MGEYLAILCGTKKEDFWICVAQLDIRRGFSAGQDVEFD
jgi:hypothetical protein